MPYQVSQQGNIIDDKGHDTGIKESDVSIDENGQLRGPDGNNVFGADSSPLTPNEQSTLPKYGAAANSVGNGMAPSGDGYNYNQDGTFSNTPRWLNAVAGVAGGALLGSTGIPGAGAAGSWLGQHAAGALGTAVDYFKNGSSNSGNTSQMTTPTPNQGQPNYQTSVDQFNMLGGVPPWGAVGPSWGSNQYNTNQGGSFTANGPGNNYYAPVNQGGQTTQSGNTGGTQQAYQQSNGSLQDYMNQLTNPALQDQILGQEQKYRPQYNNLNLQDMNQYLQGSATTPGYMQQANQVAQQQSFVENQANTAYRNAGMQDVTNLSGQARAAFDAANTGFTKQFDAASALGGQSNYYGGMQNAINGAQNFGQIGFNPAQSTNAAQVQNVRNQTIGSGQLGNLQYQQAMNAGPSQLSQGLQQQGMDALSQGGNLSPAEIRQLQQSTREAYASRGTEMGSGAVTAEALAQSQAGRQRQMENTNLASGINQQLMAEQQANRGFQSGVQGADLSRQQSNAGLSMQAQMSNQGVNQAQSLANQQYQNQFALTNQQANLSTQDLNRNFAAQQQQQNISNLGILGQAQQGQNAADRAYQMQLLQAQQSMRYDPTSMILGQQSNAQNQANTSMNAANNMMNANLGTKTFDANAGINMYMQNQANQATQANSQAGINAANTQANNANTNRILNTAITGGFNYLTSNYG